MSARADIMADQGLLQCPSWCTQDEEDEPAYGSHIGGWEQALDNGGVDEDVTVEVRAEQDWWAEEENEAARAYVRIMISGDGAAPALEGATADMYLNADEVEGMVAVLEAVQRQAEDVSSWKWAYPAAEIHAQI